MFSEQAAVEEVIQRIINRGSLMLYDHYINNKAFAFAAKNASNQLLSTVNMSFISCDPGNTPWVVVPPPPRVVIDASAKCAVSIKKPVTPSPPLRRLSSFASSVSPPASPKRQATAPLVARVVIEKLPQRETWDEIDAKVRAAKEVAAKKRSEEEERMQRRKKEETVRSQQSKKVKDELRNKSFQNDANGNIIMVNPVEASKLPPSIAVSKAGLHADGPKTLAEIPPMKTDLPPMKKLPMPEEKKDYYMKFKAQQPLAVEVIKVKPGVTLTEKGRVVKGPEDKSGVSRQQFMQTLYAKAGKINNIT